MNENRQGRELRLGREHHPGVCLVYNCKCNHKHVQQLNHGSPLTMYSMLSNQVKT
jgi:hypothetical protein